MTALLLLVLEKAVEARSTNASPNTLALAEVRLMKVRYSNHTPGREDFYPGSLRGFGPFTSSVCENRPAYAMDGVSPAPALF